jgi:hypothetical protein
MTPGHVLKILLKVLYYITGTLVLSLKMVDKSASPLQTHLGPVFCYLTVQTGLLFPERLQPSSSVGTFTLRE